MEKSKPLKKILFIFAIIGTIGIFLPWYYSYNYQLQFIYNSVIIKTYAIAFLILSFFIIIFLLSLIEQYGNRFKLDYSYFYLVGAAIILISSIYLNQDLIKKEFVEPFIGFYITIGSSLIILFFNALYIMAINIPVLNYFLWPFVSISNLESDIENRRRIYNIIANRGKITYSDLLKDSGLGNGTLYYHLRILEIEGFVNTFKIGKNRFYSIVGLSVQEKDNLPEIQKKILNILREKKRISIAEIANSIERSPQLVSYHVNILKEKNYLLIEKTEDNTYCVLRDNNLL
ncbi:MAG: winged helix-turn-helix transcriptional regulator [Thermoplasmata archaeon]